MLILPIPLCHHMIYHQYSPLMSRLGLGDTSAAEKLMGKREEGEQRGKQVARKSRGHTLLRSFFHFPLCLPLLVQIQSEDGTNNDDRHGND